MRTVFGDHQRFIDTYFKSYPGMYFTGDGARRLVDAYRRQNEVEQDFFGRLTAGDRRRLARTLAALLDRRADGPGEE